MFQAFFNLILNLLATIIQIIVSPINIIMTQALPDFSDTINNIVSAIDQVGLSMLYPYSQLPTSFQVVFSFCISTMILVTLAYRAVVMIPIVWNVVQKIKFW